MGPSTFSAPFGRHHRQYWEWFWRVLLKRKRGEGLQETDHAYLAVWFRGSGKSSCLEWSAIAEGAILGKGYVLYVGGTQDLAEGHLEAIRARLEGSEVAKYYPGMGNPKVGKFGDRFGWRQDALVTDSGWGIAAFGLDTGVRGGKRVDQRPSLILNDDFDDLHDSPQLRNKKIEVMARSIFPTGTADSVVICGQNLIYRNSVMHQIVTGTVKLLARRQVSEIIPAVYDLKIERKVDRDVIVQGRAAWEGFPIEAAQKALDDSAYEAFMAEYQHDFAATLEGLVLPEFNEQVHVITWSQFAAVYGTRQIPMHWQREVSMDWGSTGLQAHPTCVGFVATASEDSARPGLYFFYRGMTFGEGVIVDEVARRIIDEETGEDPDRPGCARIDNYRRFLASHEAKSERDTFRVKFGIPFRAASGSRTDGISMLRHFLRVDYSMPHLFKANTSGVSLLYWIIDDDQVDRGIDDRGLARWREEVIDWRWRPQEVGKGGLVQEVPVKFRDDGMDQLRYLANKWMPGVTPLTEFQKQEFLLPEGLRMENAPPDPVEREQFETARWLQQSLIARRKENAHG